MAHTLTGHTFSRTVIVQFRTVLPEPDVRYTGADELVIGTDDEHDLTDLLTIGKRVAGNMRDAGFYAQLDVRTN